MDWIPDLDAGPQGHHLLSLQLPFAKHRGVPSLPTLPLDPAQEEEDATGRADGCQSSYSLLMGGHVGARDWD